MEISYAGKQPLEAIEKSIYSQRLKNKSISITSKQGAYIFGDNLEAMIRLLDHFEGKIDLIYIDPPFNTKNIFFYDPERTSTMSNSKDTLVAYNDNLSLEDYLEFMRERLILIHKLLSDKGTLYLHIDVKVGHYLKILLDEIFGVKNFLNEITRVKSNPKNFSRKSYGNEKDVIYVYAKKIKNNIFNDIKIPYTQEEKLEKFKKVDEKGRYYTTVPCHAPGETKSGNTGGKWNNLFPPKGRHWRCSPSELDVLDRQGLIEWSKNNVPRIKKYADEHVGKKVQDVWLNFKDSQTPTYPTEKNSSMLEMIVKQSSEQGSIIMDCFCGSGSFLKAGIDNHRFVIGIDKSDISKSVSTSRSELSGLQLIELK